MLWFNCKHSSSFHLQGFSYSGVTRRCYLKVKAPCLILSQGSMITLLVFKPEMLHRRAVDFQPDQILSRCGLYDARSAWNVSKVTSAEKIPFIFLRNTSLMPDYELSGSKVKRALLAQEPTVQHTDTHLPLLHPVPHAC
ncbi:hypothetical protein MC885_005456 [Smutsia gigantea]|nr:hypothetical protein MC885_005456 [Smutsia gigantea]